MKTVVHINQFAIRKNKATGSRHPVITVKTYKSNVYAHEVELLDRDGRIAARVIYSPDKPLSCGARVWIETVHEVRAVGDTSAPLCMKKCGVKKERKNVRAKRAA